VAWSNEPETVRWRRWIGKRAQVTGRYTGTTDQILRWAACRWGIAPDLLRAVALQESDWRQGAVGDAGASFGIMQVKDHYPDGSPAWGGYPATSTATALNADFYAAYIRSCFDGDFADGGDWLYHGRTIAQVIAAHDSDYAIWGCVGSWYSGEWYDPGAQAYIRAVKARLAARAWERLSVP
jgi:autotransporter family porin